MKVLVPALNKKQQFQIPVTKELGTSLPYFSVLQGEVTHGVEVVWGGSLFFIFLKICVHPSPL